MLGRLRPHRENPRGNGPVPAQIATDRAEPRGPWIPPPEPPSRFLLEDQPGRDGDGNSRWLPLGADTATAQPGQASTATFERPPAGLETTATEPQRASAPEPNAYDASDRRSRAVEAYCAEICLSGQGSSAAAETLGSFAGGGDHDLLRMTRALAAKHVNPIPEELRGWRDALTVQRTHECTSTPAFLAARDNDELSGEEKLKLENHCESCVTCQALELRSRRAERIFAAIMGIIPTAAGAATGGKETSATSEPAVAPAEAEDAPETSGPGESDWIPAELASAEPNAAPGRFTPGSAPGAAEPTAPAAGTISTPAAEPRGSRRRRRGLILGAATAVAAAAIAAGVLLANGSGNGVSAARTNIAAKQAATAAARHRAAKPGAAVHAHHGAARAATRPPAAAPTTAASPGPAPQASPAPVSRPSATPTPASSVRSSPKPSESAPSTPASTPAAPQSGASFHQPSLGATNAPQGLGSKH